MEALFKAHFSRRFEPLAGALEQFVPAGGVIADVGANTGRMARSLSRLRGGSVQVLAFEPLGYNLTILRTVASRRRNIRVFDVALSERAGEAAFYLPFKADGRVYPGNAALAAARRALPGPGEGTLHEVKVRTVTLDALARDERLERLDLVKADVEGGESLVLRGAKDTLARFRPAIFMELPFHPDQDPRSGEVLQTLGELGYRLCLLDVPGGRVTPIPAQTGAKDYLFVHADRLGA
jgi:FkbM family methyltransferase